MILVDPCAIVPRFQLGLDMLGVSLDLPKRAGRILGEPSREMPREADKLGGREPAALWPIFAIDLVTQHRDDGALVVFIKAEATRFDRTKGSVRVPASRYMIFCRIAHQLTF